MGPLQLGDRLAELLSTRYGLANPILVGRDVRGMSSANCVIADGDASYFLKVYNPKRFRERILEIHAAEEYFFHHGVPAIVPLKCLDGESVFEFEDRFYSLFPFVHGRVLDRLPNERGAASMGDMLARIHLASRTDDSLEVVRQMRGWDRERFLDDANALLLRLTHVVHPPVHPLALVMLRKKIALAETTALRFEDMGFRNDSILHGDYHYGNVFFDRDDHVTHVFDFERVRRGARAAEVAEGIFLNCFGMNLEGDDPITDSHIRLAERFIAGYTQAYPMMHSEIAQGLWWYFYAQMVHDVWPLNEHYLAGDRRADRILAKRYDRLTYFAHHLDEVVAKLCHV